MEFLDHDLREAIYGPAPVTAAHSWRGGDYMDFPLFEAIDRERINPMSDLHAQYEALRAQVHRLELLAQSDIHEYKHTQREVINQFVQLEQCVMAADQKCQNVANHKDALVRTLGGRMNSLARSDMLEGLRTSMEFQVKRLITEAQATGKLRAPFLVVFQQATTLLIDCYMKDPDLTTSFLHDKKSYTIFPRIVLHEGLDATELVVPAIFARL